MPAKGTQTMTREDLIETMAEAMWIAADTIGRAESRMIAGDALAAIEAADSIEGLQIAFAAAYKACKADHKATTSLMAMKDSRKAVLSQKAAA